VLIINVYYQFIDAIYYHPSMATGFRQSMAE